MCFVLLHVAFFNNKWGFDSNITHFIDFLEENEISPCKALRAILSTHCTLMKCSSKCWLFFGPPRSFPLHSDSVSGCFAGKIWLCPQRSFLQLFFHSFSHSESICQKSIPVPKLNSRSTNHRIRHSCGQCP